MQAEEEEEGHRRKSQSGADAPKHCPSSSLDLGQIESLLLSFFFSDFPLKYSALSPFWTVRWYVIYKSVVSHIVICFSDDFYACPLTAVLLFIY